MQLRTVTTVVVACTLLAPSAAAQLAHFSWSYVGEPSGFANVNATSAHIQGGDDPGIGCSGDGTSRLITSAGSAGWVFAHYDFENQDTGFGYWTAEDPIVVVGDDFELVGPGDIFDTWSGDVAFHVTAGQSFGFGVRSVDCVWGPGVLDVTAFEFVPDTWADLGHALPGLAGAPVFTGLGPLAADTPWTLSLISAAPDASAWLLLSTSEVSAAFKGGVLVPNPVGAAIKNTSTNAQGRIVWNGTWPAGIPAGIPLFAQWWIQDAGAPLGWAASNAIQRATH